MNIQQLLVVSLETADTICLGYLQDLSDRDLMLRPHDGCNHINWQVGHLIQSEHEMMQMIAPMPALPAGFANRYSKETQASNRREDFCSKDELLEAHREQREGTLAILERIGETDLDRKTGVDYAPTFGALLALISAHWLMHAGQWVIVRRELGRPLLF
jgi:DinB family protein